MLLVGRSVEASPGAACGACATCAAWTWFGIISASVSAGVESINIFWPDSIPLAYDSSRVIF